MLSASGLSVDVTAHRVLLCADYVPPSDGGVEHVVETLARRLDAMGHEVGVFTLDSGTRPTLADHDSIELYQADTVDLTNVVGLQSSFSVDALVRFRSILREFEPDLLHVHNRFFFTSYVAGLIYGSRSDLPVVTTLHLGDVGEIGGLGGFAAGVFERTFGRALLARSDQVIAVSESVAEQARTLGVTDDRLTVARNAVEVDEFPYSPPDDDPDVVFVGRLVRNNGPLDFVEAVVPLVDRFPDSRYHVVGTGPLGGAVDDAIADHGLDDVFTRHGFVDDIRSVYDLADVFCRPSYSEGLPLTLLEAMASGVPPVVSEVAGVPEVVTDRETGLLVQPGDVQGVTESLAWLLEEPARMDELSRNARAYAEAELSWDARVEKVLSVYAAALEP